MGIFNQRLVEATGAPLAVCINDCRIDCGQGASELAPVCFRVGCAFAEMRWGSLSDQYRSVAETPDRPEAADQQATQGSCLNDTAARSA